MYWAFDNPASKRAGARAPEPLKLTYGHREPEAGRPHGVGLQRAYTVSGREVRPADCGPVRLLSRFGHVVRAPGRATLLRESPPRRWRDHGETSSAYGPVRVAGDRWHGTESGFVASWISGSEYVKISTGVLVYFPKGHLLYQGPVPNRTLTDEADIAVDLDVMAGLEYFVPARSTVVDGQTYGIAALNVIVRVPPGPEPVEVHKHQVIGWFHLVAPRSGQDLAPLPHTSEERP